MQRATIINPGWTYYSKLTYSPAVKKGNILFISGQNASEFDFATGKVLIKGDIVSQTEAIYKKFEAILAAAGGSFDDITMTTDYVTDWDDYRKTGEIRRMYLKDNRPAATAVLVKGLIGNALIEIDAIAMLG
jgi:2-iminobutanoate/2-iminopropanoate deaminase